MANKEGRLVDPVAEGQQQKEHDEQVEQMKTLSTEALSLDDFRPIPVTAARQPHPFEGYPQKKIKIGTYQVRGEKAERDLIVSATHIVALNPKQYVHQDPSGKGISMVVDGQEKIVDIPTSHSRVVRDQMGKNTIVVFDREIILEGGRKMARCAICPDHTARAQIVFKVDQGGGKIQVDNRYVLADIDQVGRLRRLFETFHYQQTQSERLAQKFYDEPESAAQ